VYPANIVRWRRSRRLEAILEGLGNRLIVPLAEHANYEGDIACRERLGGLLKYDHRSHA